MRVFLPGGTGFLGSVTGEKLRELGHEVVAGSRSTRTDVVMDVRTMNTGDLRRLLTDVSPDVVIDMVGTGLGALETSESEISAVNCEWPIRLAQGLTELGGIELVHVASSTALKQVNGLRESPYSESKARASRDLTSLRSRGVNVNQVILHNVYGPGQPPQRFVQHVVDAALNQAVICLRHPNRVRDFIFISDAVEMICSTVDSPMAANGRHIGSGQGHSLNEVARLIYTLVGSDPDLIHHMEDSSDLFPSTIAPGAFLVGQAQVSLPDGLKRAIEASIRERAQ